ncbi:ArsR family transcriptional regulator [Kitasatospora sp. NPDC093679]|uniref:AAA family ATPase n=1 Tax=Kitasatospora sp. NPDC093679 TaxID=3154983 RepID=UPI0034338DCF
MGSATTAVGRPATLFDRAVEWEALAAFATDPHQGPAVGMVTGPRGQGKTFLLHELARATGGFHFAAQEAAEAESLRRLADRFAHHTGASAVPHWQGWQDALEALLALAADRPLPIVLDGFPELVRQSPALPAAVHDACRRLRESGTPNRARVLLCGSDMPVMNRLAGGAAARADFRLEVSRLDHWQGARLWNVQDPVLALRLSAVVGTSPVFRHDAAGEDTPAHADDFDAWICRTVLNPRLPLFWRAGHLIEVEPDGWDRSLAHSTVTALADGYSTPGDIADRLARPATEIPHILTRLGDCGLVQAVPDAFRPGATHFCIAEPLLAFDHAVIRPHRGELERREAAEVWRTARVAFESTVLEQHFARVCREWAAGFGSVDTFGAAPATVSPGILPPVSGRAPLRADVAVRGEARGRPGPLLSVGRASWHDVLDLHDLRELQELVAALAELGEDVSRTRPALYSAAGFSPDLRAAEEQGELILVDPHRLYYGV